MATFIIEIILFNLKTLTNFNKEIDFRIVVFTDPKINLPKVSKGIVARRSIQNLPFKYASEISLILNISLPVFV